MEHVCVILTTSQNYAAFGNGWLHSCLKIPWYLETNDPSQAGLTTPFWSQGEVRVKQTCPHCILSHLSQLSKTLKGLQDSDSIFYVRT